MAIVWRAFDTQLKRIVAVKVLHPHLHGREEIRKRFAREARAVARLSHANILDVFDSSEPESEPSWLVMEFIRGQTLRQFADLHAFDPPELGAACVLLLADALEHAHAAGVIHRDVKPENVMVREDGTLKLTDFGIAAVVEPDEKFTVTGQILGSPSHLAPEILEGKQASAQSDLFSLGTILYWLSCGQLPFRAPTPAALLRLIMECKPQDPRMVRGSISDAQAALCLRCLAKDPLQRPTSAAELSRELARLLADSGIDNPREELASFLRSAPPEARAAELRARLVTASLARGEEALQARKTSAALASFSRALALDPKNELAGAQVQKIHQRSRTLRLVRRGALGASLALLLGVGGTRAGSLLHSELQPAPLAPPIARTPPPPPETSVMPAPPASEVAATTPSPKDPPLQPTAETPANEAEARPSPRPAPRRPRDPPRVAVVDEAPQKARPPLKQGVTILVPLPATLVLDGENLGTELFFNTKVTPGTHSVSVQKEGFADWNDKLDVQPGRTEYRLRLGTPKPALVTVSGAPADAPVRIDDALLGTVGELMVRPKPYSMSTAYQDVTLTVGTRSMKVRLKAGQTQAFDMLKSAGGGK